MNSRYFVNEFASPEALLDNLKEINRINGKQQIT